MNKTNVHERKVFSVGIRLMLFKSFLLLVTPDDFAPLRFFGLLGVGRLDKIKPWESHHEVNNLKVTYFTTSNRTNWFLSKE